MKTIAQGYEINQLQVIATSAVREASNRRRFVKRVRDRLGMDVEEGRSQRVGAIVV